MEVVVNAAMSADGKISTAARRQVRISGQEDFERVDRLRANVDAIMVGIGTVLSDDPHLIIDDIPKEDQPVRVAVDSAARTPLDAEILDNASSTVLLVSDRAPADRVEALEERASVYRVGAERVDLPQGLEVLEAIGIETVLVEGGGELIFSLIEQRLVDRLSVFIGGTVIGGRDAPTLADGAGFRDDDAFATLDLTDIERLDHGVLLSWEIV